MIEEATAGRPVVTHGRHGGAGLDHPEGPGRPAPRARRATDLIELVAASLGLAPLRLVASPPSGFEQALITFVAALPGALDGLCRLFVDGLGLLALVVVA